MWGADYFRQVVIGDGRVFQGGVEGAFGDDKVLFELKEGRNVSRSGFSYMYVLHNLQLI